MTKIDINNSKLQMNRQDSLIDQLVSGIWMIALISLCIFGGPMYLHWFVDQSNQNVISNTETELQVYKMNASMQNVVAPMLAEAMVTKATAIGESNRLMGLDPNRMCKSDNGTTVSIMTIAYGNESIVQGTPLESKSSESEGNTLFPVILLALGSGIICYLFYQLFRH